MRNTTCVPPPKSVKEGYHLSEDLRGGCDQLATGSIKPSSRTSRFYMYWASGAIHGPHHVTKEWTNKYKGKFDDGWDAYRERVFKRAKEKGWVPAEAQLTAAA